MLRSQRAFAIFARKVRRVHGCALAPRWNGEGLPPVVTREPNRGAPALERTHGFHGKVLPGALLGARCNHDMRNLLHLPVLSEELSTALVKRSALKENPSRSSHGDDVNEDAALTSAIDEGIEMMVEELVTRMYYTAGYAGKEQPQAANLLHTLHDSLVRFDHFEAERQAQQRSTEPVERARRLLQSLVAATNRRMHLGFPTIYASLLGKPNH